MRSLSPDQLQELLHDWSFRAHEEQKPPAGDWQFWLFLAGRGAGKTRAGAEWIRGKVKSGCSRLALIAATAADARDVMIDGPSGILATAWKKDTDHRGNVIGRPEWQPARHRVIWENGAVGHVYSAEEPDRLRGPQHDGLWADELAAWKDVGKELRVNAWDMAMFGLRIGANPQAMISTTPRPIPIIRELKNHPACRVTTATTYKNRPFLARAFFTNIIAKYEGTRLGRQELLGQVIEEAEGALWTRAMIEAARGAATRPDLTRIVVAVDPAVTANPTSNLTGIVVAGLGTDGRGYVLADLSGRFTPDQWAQRAVKAYDDWQADRIVAEGNQGGELVRANLKTVRPNISVRIVHASRSKQARAEPVAALYEQSKITHCVPFPELEDQLCTWAPLSGDPSPDRLDALVWAITDLMLKAVTKPPFVSPVIVGVPRHWPGSGDMDF